MDKKHFLVDREKIIIQKKGHQICVLSCFNQEKNVFTVFREGNHLRYFLPPAAPFEEGFNGTLFHTGWDDFAPYLCRDHMTIGANHGSPFTFKISMLRHWLDDSDIGKTLSDDEGNSFIITDIKNVSEFLIHSVPEKNGSKVTFKTVCGSLYLDGRKLDGKIQQTQHSVRCAEQLAPHHRYNSIELLADGRTKLADGEICECNSAVLLLDMDLCTAVALVDHIKNNPGKYTSPVSPELPALLNNRMLIEFQSSCAYTVNCRITVLQDCDDSMRYSLLQSYNETQPQVQKKFIPGVKPLAVTGNDGKTYLLNPAQGMIYQQGKYRYMVTKDDCTNQGRLPNEFIDLWGDGEKFLWGEVIGYSNKYGITRRGAENQRSDVICSLPVSGKSYPYALYCPVLKKGNSYHIAAYRQFFDPGQSAAISSYGHREHGIYTHYCNYTSPCLDKIKLPGSCSGMKIKIEENTCGAVLIETVPADGVVPVEISGSGTLIFSVT